MCGAFRRLKPPFLTLVSIPTWLSGSANKEKDDGQQIYKKKIDSNPERSRFILGSVFKRLRNYLEKLTPDKDLNSTWSDYMSPKSHFTQAYFAAKNDFVKNALEELQPARVLDVGCNSGHFSALAAKIGAGVVAIDYDPVVVGDVWRRATNESLDILPLAVNLTRPTPSTGWRNAECPSFLDRARGSFDCVLMLAVIHHMLVTERIPLEEILDLAAEITTDSLILEFVPADDPLFVRLTRGREELHKGLTKEKLEAATKQRFHIVRSQQLVDSDRSIYLLRKKR
jgi:SAM-dependent methyltransferase